MNSKFKLKEVFDMRFVWRNLVILLVIAFVFTVTSAWADRPGYRYVLSSGLFGLPSNAASVDWVVANNSTSVQRIRVTVYQWGIGIAKTEVAPGPITETLNPGYATHNANSVGYSCGSSSPGPFIPGFYYEVVVETGSLNVIPSVSIWQDCGNTVIPGTTILPGNFVSIP